jgi:hypothetical protein
MDDFRVGSISPYDPYGDQGPSDSMDRKKKKRPQDQSSEQDEIVDVIERAGTSGEQVEGSVEPEDYYSPSDPTKGSE